MKHFSKSDWQLYVKDLLGESKRNIMENHLLFCDECLEMYLSSVDIAMDDKEDYLLSPGFTESLMVKVQKEKLHRGNVKIKKREKRLVNILIYYTAVACITLLFMSKGVFNMIGDNTIRVTEQLLNSEIKTEELVINDEWYSNIIEKSNQIFSSINPLEGRE